MNRIQQKLKEDKKLLSIYFTPGYPSINDTVTTIENLEKNGVDMIEWDDDGKILNFKVMIRPFKAVEIVRRKMVEALEQI